MTNSDRKMRSTVPDSTSKLKIDNIFRYIDDLAPVGERQKRERQKERESERKTENETKIEFAKSQTYQPQSSKS